MLVLQGEEVCPKLKQNAGGFELLKTSQNGRHIDLI